jgi:hypothetical protein
VVTKSLPFLHCLACVWQRALSRRYCRYLDRARLRHCCGRDHPGATRVNAGAEVAEEDNGLTHDCYNQGHDHGHCAVSVHL